MLVNHDGKQYYVDFRHDRPRQDRTEVLVDSLGRRHVICLDSPDQRRMNRQRTTTCAILLVQPTDPASAGQPPSETTIVTGTATCGDGDRFDKDVGRRLSLARATSRIDGDQGLKGAIWRAYVNRKGCRGS